MRNIYHEQLESLGTDLARACGLAGEAMGRATRALLDADLAEAEGVISDHQEIARVSTRAESTAVSLLALQQPVAGELRAIVSSLKLAADIERMGGLAVHVAKIARRRHPEHVLPDAMRDLFIEMGKVAVDISMTARHVLLTGDAETGAELRHHDDAMDDLHDQLYAKVLHDWPFGVQAGIDAALLGRFYERFADHAVEVGRRVVFEVTGTLPPEPGVSTY
ncbi:phosphate signaling complex protein PhoU [Mycolicibacterium thermoresistibile]